MESTEGVILNTLHFKDYDLIVTVFSPGLGLCKFYVKGALRPSKKASAPCLLSRCEFEFRQGKGNLLICEEVTVVNQFLGLRRDYSTLEIACQLLQMLLRSQMPDKPAPDLYKLLLKYLEGLGSASDPKVIKASFQLKLLRHDGHFYLPEACQKCGKILEGFQYFYGECFCPGHEVAGSLHFNPEEADMLRILAYCRSLADLRGAVLASELEEKITAIYTII